MQAHKLVPLKPIADRKPDENLQKMRAKLRRHSRYWPLTSGTTLVYNMRQYIDPLLNLVSKDDLTDNDVLQCRQAIFSLVSLSTRNEQLSLPILGNRWVFRFLSKVKSQVRLFSTELKHIRRRNCTKSFGRNWRR